MKALLIVLAALCVRSAVVFGQLPAPTPTAEQKFAVRFVQEKDAAQRAILWQAQKSSLNCALAQELNTEADKLIRAGQNARALDVVPFAQEAAATCRTKREWATAINHRGRAHFQMSEYEPARRDFEEALALRRPLEDKLELAQSLNNLASYYEVKARYNLALRYYEESQQLKQQLAAAGQANDTVRGSIARTEGNIGLGYRYLGDYDTAQKHFQQSIPIFTALADWNGLATIFNYLGDMFTDMGQWEQALTAFQQSLAYQQKAPQNDELQAQILNNIGLVHYFNKNYDQALAACQESLRLRRVGKNTERIARTERRLAMIHLAKNELPAALQYAQDAAQLSQQHPETFWKARVVEGEVQVALQNTAAAKRYFTEAIQQIEEMRTQAPRAPDIQQRFFENKTLPYLALTDLLLATKRPQEALAYAERTKARVILDLIQAAPAAPAAQLPAWLASTATMQRALDALSPDADTVLLEFVIAKEKVHLFALTKTQGKTDIQTIPLTISTTQLQAQVRQFRAQVADRKLNFTAQAQTLYQQLLHPAAALLRQKKQLVIVPDGVLWELPFQALLTDANNFLWESHTISYTPSLAAWQMLQQRPRRTAPLSLLALGNPTLPPDDAATPTLPTLTYAARQVQELSQIYGRQHSKVLLGAAATEQALKTEAAQYAVIHLATHGIYDDRNPMASRVLLAATKEDDGKVEAQEILNLKLTNELIVLSACETGRGRLGPGEGVIGLTWAFLIAGCPTLVASQWEVRDDSTSALMTRFHRALKTSAQPKAEALRQAALALMKLPQYKHPYHWAGFVVVGDGN
ncbi:MAG: CHAT domain-containing tetratricopeptide repeat protein [Blastocatellia bacterium]